MAAPSSAVRRSAPETSEAGAKSWPRASSRKRVSPPASVTSTGEKAPPDVGKKDTFTRAGEAPVFAIFKSVT